MRRTMKTKAQTVVGALLIFAALHCAADSWQFKSSERAYKFSRGYRVIVGVDARKSSQSPHFYVRILDRGKLIALYPGVGFDELVVSPDEELFVGLSNTGIPSTAAVVFDREGRLLHSANHDSPHFQYCRYSVTMDRTWYDDGDPNVRFEDQMGSRATITLRNCAGDQVYLLQPDRKVEDPAIDKTSNGGGT
jgi:hypothetical protein